MIVIAKVVRCNRHQFRLGLFLPKTLKTVNVKSLRIELQKRIVNVKNVNDYQRYKSIIDPQVGRWIVQEKLDHNAGENLHLLKFELLIEGKGESHLLKYLGRSIYTKIPHKNICVNSIDGNILSATDDIINVL